MKNPGVAWYRPPVVWLGIAILLGSLTGCVVLIVAALRV